MHDMVDARSAALQSAGKSPIRTVSTPGGTAIGRRSANAGASRAGKARHHMRPTKRGPGDGPVPSAMARPRVMSAQEGAVSRIASDRQAIWLQTKDISPSISFPDI